MKRKLISAAIALACVGSAIAQGPAPATVEAWAARMADPTQNASAFKDPGAFVQWSNAMANPAMIPAMGNVMMDPGAYTRMLYGMMSPGAYRNYMQFTDPNVAMRWMGAGMDPRFYMGMGAPMLNPASYMNWMTAPMDPRMWNMGMQAMNPALYSQWLASPMDPKVMGLMTAPMNPQTYGTWMGAIADPRTYPALQLMQMPAAGVAPAPFPIPAQ